MADARRSIPSVDRLLSAPAFVVLQRQWPRALVVNALQDELAQLRSALREGSAGAAPEDEQLAERVAESLTGLVRPSLLPVINATGVVLHTNLGRAPLARAALDAITAVASGYSSLEYDAASGARGSRYVHCQTLLARLTGAEDALVVNNNAAALVLVLNTLARGFEAIVSRGELVEIGGAFRVPDIMGRSGARLREVGSTNRTHVTDYREALSFATGAILKVHPSNFAVTGYAAEVGIADLAAVAAQARVPLIHDIGSGLLLDPTEVGLPAGEPTPQSSLAASADVVTMSGDKLLGGPQCGIILGSTELLERMRRNPMCRALRVDKLTLAALAATLGLYVDPERARREIPVLRMLTLDATSIEARATAFARKCAEAGVSAHVAAGASAVGGGAAAAAILPTALLLLERPGLTAHEFERRLRMGSPCAVTRIVEGRVAIDLRTVAPDEEPLLLQAIEVAGGATDGPGDAVEGVGGA